MSGIAIAVAGVLAFTGITANKFWDDEANTAIFAQNLLDTGQLSAWNGTNLIGYRDGAELDENLVNVFMPPLQYWLAAVGITFFGGDELGLRVLFVLSGLLCMIALALFARGMLGDRFPWYLPLWLTALAPAFLLYIRNCRYYSPGAALSIGLLACLAGGIHTGRGVLLRALLAAVLSTLLMFTSYFNAAGTLVALPFLLLFRAHRTRRHLIVGGAAYLCAGIAGVYVLMTHNPFATSVPRPDEVEGIEKIATLLWRNLRDIGTFEFFPVALLPVLALPFLVKKLSSLVNEAKIGLAVAGMMLAAVIVTSLFSPQSVSGSTLADMRYLVPLIPLGTVATAVILSILWRLARPMAIGAVGLLVFSNILHLGFAGTHNSYLPTRGVECTLCQYIGEVTSDRTTNTEAIFNYLEKLSEDDVLLVVPPFMGYSPMYYLPRHKFCCQLMEDHPLSDEIRKELPDYLFWERAHRDLDVALINAMPPASKEGPLAIRGVNMGYYHYVEVLDIPARDCSRPEIPWHSFDGTDVKKKQHHRFFVVRLER